ncbi:MAG: hypothetical protein U0939_25390 [Pirellulales bacterium]
MNGDPRDWIDGYLDDSISPDEFVRLAEWVRASPEHAVVFARRAWLHDRLQVELRVAAERTSTGIDSSRAASTAMPSEVIRRRRERRKWYAALSTVVVIVLVLLAGGRFAGENPAAAAAKELDRLIAANRSGMDREFLIVVDDAAGASGRKGREAASAEKRPPKAPLDGAHLTVRDAGRFVLRRQMPDGRPFITGANGVVSWAVRPDGPVRVSSDPTHFQRDVPGHEHAMSLANLDEMLQQLRSAYDVQLLPDDGGRPPGVASHESTRTLIAVRRRGQRGPRVVEADYVAQSRQIRALRFIEMPYGPDRLTIRLTLVGATQRPDQFYEHAAHHEADRIVEQEP